LKLRQRFGTFNIPKNDALRAVVNFKREKKNFALGFIADQTPSRSNLHYWTNFLNQDTPFLNGPERIAQKNGYAVIYFDVQKVKRGYYTCDLILLTDNAKDTKENEITDKYVELFEKTLRKIRLLVVVSLAGNTREAKWLKQLKQAVKEREGFEGFCGDLNWNGRKMMERSFPSYAGIRLWRGWGCCG
jgi:hypothetical protein